MLCHDEEGHMQWGCFWASQPPLFLLQSSPVQSSQNLRVPQGSYSARETSQQKLNSNSSYWSVSSLIFGSFFSSRLVCVEEWELIAYISVGALIDPNIKNWTSYGQGCLLCRDGG